MSLLTNMTADVTVAGGMAISLSPSYVQAVPLPASYYTDATDADDPTTVAQAAVQSAPAADASSQSTPITGPAKTKPDPAQLQRELDAALQKNGLKAEIDIKSVGLMVVRFIDEGTGQTVFQTPPEGVLELIASLQQSQSKNAAPKAGLMFDGTA